MDLTPHILIALAVYRLARMLAYEDGPGDVLVQLRQGVARRFGLESWQARGVSCPLCVGFWLAPLLWLAWLVLPALIVWLAIAGAACWLQTREEG